MNEIKRQALSRLIGDFSIAGFQERSTERILRAWHFHSNHAHAKEATGTIVCAGTGSGKTLAFYLPALTSLLNDIQRDNAQRVRTLALYPRKELLKDQFMETWGKCRELDSQALTLAGRKIRIGSFSVTPRSAINTQQKIKTRICPLIYSVAPRQNVRDKCTGKQKISN